jgi:hypothetical protein
VASTAERIEFQQGFFSATNPNSPPLLTVNLPTGLPTGLLMGANAQPIQVQGQGHGLNSSDPVVVFVTGPVPPSRLAVSPGQSLVLLGGAIDADGGVLRAEQGRVELGAVQDDRVGLRPTDSGMELDYRGVNNFRDIQLLNESLVDVSAPSHLLGGIRGGSIQVRGRHITLQNGSLLLNQNLGFAPSGDIEIYGSESFTLDGPIQRDNAALRAGIINSSAFVGDGGNVTITTDLLSLLDGGTIANLSLGLGNGGALILTPMRFA